MTAVASLSLFLCVGVCGCVWQVSYHLLLLPLTKMNVVRYGCSKSPGHFPRATGSAFHCLRFCVLRVLSPELVAPLLSFFLTDIPLLPGSPRRLSSRTVARGGPKQYLRVPSPQAAGQRASASQHSSQASRRECSRNSSVSIGGHPKGASHLALLSCETCVCLWAKPWVFGRALFSSLSPSQAHFAATLAILFSEGSGREKRAG